MFVANEKKTGKNYNNTNLIVIQLLLRKCWNFIAHFLLFFSIKPFEYLIRQMKLQFIYNLNLLTGEN